MCILYLRALEPGEESSQASKVALCDALVQEVSLALGEFPERHIQPNLKIVGQLDQLFQLMGVGGELSRER